MAIPFVYDNLGNKLVDVNGNFVVLWYSPTQYTITLRDKAGNLKAQLQPFITNLSWEWNRLGGCGNCNITVKAEYRSVEFNAGDDIRIYVNYEELSKLVYRGYVDKVSPSLKINQDIKINCRGYFDLLKKIIVQDTGDTKTYTNTEISAIVLNIVDNFITPNTLITKGTIDVNGFVADSLEFLTDVGNALETLSNLAGDAEYGVDEMLRFFWRTESETIQHRFLVGNNISSLERSTNWSNLVNRIYLIGGDVAGVKYKKTINNSDSQDIYYLSEEILNNSSITTDSVAYQYAGTILKEKSSPIFNIKAKIVNTDVRIEDNIPIGLVQFYDSDHDDQTTGDIIGEAVDGGSDITIGELSDGGSDVTVGGTYSGQVNRLSYELSDTEGRFNVSVELGDTVLETSAKIKRMDLALKSIQQEA